MVSAEPPACSISPTSASALFDGAVVMNEDMRAVGGEALGDGAADAARCAGDEGSFVGKLLGHGKLLQVSAKWACDS